MQRADKSARNITGIGAIMQPTILIMYYCAPFRLHEAVAVCLKQHHGHCQGTMYGALVPCQGIDTTYRSSREHCIA